jgi:hypothetical protein
LEFVVPHLKFAVWCLDCCECEEPDNRGRVKLMRVVPFLLIFMDATLQVTCQP